MLAGTEQFMPDIDIAALERLETLIGGDRGALIELIGTFLEETDEILTDMRGAVASEERAVLHRGAHSLKSSAQDFGADELAVQAATLESRSAAEWPADAGGDVDRLAEAFAASRASLQRWLAEQDA